MPDCLNARCEMGFEGHTGDSAARHMQGQALTVSERYDEIFDIEIDCWCYGFIKFPGEITAPLVHRVIKELAPVLQAAIDHNFAFDILKSAHLIFKATAGVVSEKELCFSLLAQLPAPHMLTEDGQFVLAQVLDQAERSYEGVLARMEKRWRTARDGPSAAEKRLMQRVSS